MTMLTLAPGRPATGTPLRVDMSRYQTLSDEQKARMQVSLVVGVTLEFGCMCARLRAPTCSRLQTSQHKRIPWGAGSGACQLAQ